VLAEDGTDLSLATGTSYSFSIEGTIYENRAWINTGDLI